MALEPSENPNITFIVRDPYGLEAELDTPEPSEKPPVDNPRCEARIRPMVPINDTELRCEMATHADPKHVSTLRDYAFPGSATVVQWLDDDRRNFIGPWVECIRPGCILPNNHREEHAS